jgi:nucleoid-associated protein YgaU
MPENEDSTPQTYKHKNVELKRADQAEEKKAAAKTISEHVVVGGDTLSHISLNYYGSATKPYWMVIYEANKELIGDNPNKLKRGITLKIPELPAELKKK